MSAMPAETFTFDDVLARLRSVLHETFEIDPAKVTPEAHLFTDLELDSIDAIDLAIQVQDMTGARIKPEDFKSVRTVGDVVATVRALSNRCDVASRARERARLRSLRRNTDLQP